MHTRTDMHTHFTALLPQASPVFGFTSRPVESGPAVADRADLLGSIESVAGESGASFWVPMADLAIMEPGFAICSIELVGGAAGSTGKHGGRTWDNAIHHYDNYFHFICLPM